MLLLLLMACDPCRVGVEVEVSDPDGALDAGTLERMARTVEEFYAGTGATEICLDKVVVQQVSDGRWETAGRVVYIDPAAAVSDYLLRSALCARLDDRYGYSAIHGEDFVSTCARGPRHFWWADQVAAACGVTHLTALDATVRDLVWVHAAPEPSHQDLYISVGSTESFDVGSEDQTFVYVAAAGDLLAVQRYSGQDETLAAEVAFFDPATWTETSASPVAGVGGLTSADGFVVHDEYVDGAWRLTSVHPDGATHTVETTEYTSGGSAVAGGHYFMSSTPWGEDGEPMFDVDLTTGEVLEIDLPGPPTMVPMAYPELAVGEDLLVSLMAAEIEVTSAVTVITTYDQSYQLYTPATDTWTEVGRDFDFWPAGSTAEGRVFGTLSVAAGELYAAWDPAGGTWLISDDVCAERYYDPAFVLGDTAWRAWRSDENRAILVQELALSGG